MNLLNIYFIRIFYKICEWYSKLLYINKNFTIFKFYVVTFVIVYYVHFIIMCLCIYIFTCHDVIVTIEKLLIYETFVPSDNFKNVNIINDQHKFLILGHFE